MLSITVIDRETKERTEELVYGGMFLSWIYGTSYFSRFVGAPFLLKLVKLPWFSALFAYWQYFSWTRRKVIPFIDKYKIDSSEFQVAPKKFKNFNDFFIRKLKAECRPVVKCSRTLVAPADGRYLVFSCLNKLTPFFVKGQELNLETLLQSSEQAEKYHGGSLVIARLAPMDYHRFHFPFQGVPSQSRLLDGLLYSVNPIATKKKISIFCENRRFCTEFFPTSFKEFLILEVGATNVGSVTQTYQSQKQVEKGQEKGFFSFGASAVLLLFQKNQVVFDSDLQEASEQGLEVRCKFGQSLATFNIL